MDIFYVIDTIFLCFFSLSLSLSGAWVDFIKSPVLVVGKGQLALFFFFSFFPAYLN